MQRRTWGLLSDLDPRLRATTEDVVRFAVVADRCDKSYRGLQCELRPHPLDSVHVVARQGSRNRVVWLTHGTRLDDTSRPDSELRWAAGFPSD